MYRFRTPLLVAIDSTLALTIFRRMKFLCLQDSCPRERSCSFSGVPRQRQRQFREKNHHHQNWHRKDHSNKCNLRRKIGRNRSWLQENSCLTRRRSERPYFSGPSSSRRSVSVPTTMVLLFLLLACDLCPLVCHAWTHCTTPFHQKRQTANTIQLFVTAHPFSDSLASSFDDDDDENRHSRDYKAINQQRQNRGCKQTRSNQQQSKRARPKTGQVSTNSSRKVTTFRSKQPVRTRATNKRNNDPVVQFNKELQNLLHTNYKQPPPPPPPPRAKVVQAQEMLLARVHAAKNKHNTTATTTTVATAFDTISFNLVMRGWARQQSIEAARAADHLLRILWQETACKADSYSYSAVLHAYAKAKGGRPAALRATELLQEFLQLPQQANNNQNYATRALLPDICHNAVMDAWALSGDARAGQRAEQILRQLHQDPRRNATRIAYSSCLKAYAKSGQPEQAQRILGEMKQSVATGNSIIAPDKVCYSTCIHAWAKATKDFTLAAARADELLCEMENIYEQTGNESMRPDIISYSSVLAASAKAGESSSKPLELLDRMERYGRERPNAHFLNTWIHLLSKTNETNSAVASAEAILEHMKAELAKGNDRLRPCKKTYTAVITVLAKLRSADAAERAEGLLDELIVLWKYTRDNEYRPNAKTFASVLNAISKSGVENGMERAAVLLKRMQDLYKQTGAKGLQPNLIVYMQIFQILARSRNPNAGAKAKETLQQMRRLSLAGHEDVRPDATIMAYFLNTLTKSADVENVVELATHIVNEVEEGYNAGVGQLRPTSLLYSAALQAYAKSASAEGARLAEALLQRCKKMYQEGKLYAKPTVLFYNAVMDAHARSNGGVAAAERTEELLEEMEAKSRAGDSSVQPNTRSFNAAILAWKNSEAHEAPHRAEALLKQMNERYKAGDQECRPDRVTINCIISAWAKGTDPQGPQRAAAFLEFIESPDQYTFNSCIDAYARRGDGPGAQRLYERMQELSVKDSRLEPSLITLTALQTAWIKSSLTDEAAEHLPKIQSLIDECNRSIRFKKDSKHSQ